MRLVARFKALWFKRLIGITDKALMNHVREIEKMVNSGLTAEAHDALDNLLALGPNNVAALKLRAFLYGFQGLYNQENQVWQKVLSIDEEDFDAIGYFHQKHIEERENFYFTDDLPAGGRKFLAYPRALIKTSMLGLAGCLVFLLVGSYLDRLDIAPKGALLLTIFAICVLAPWLAIGYIYIKALRSVSITREGFEVATRFRRIDYKWTEISSMNLVYSFETQPHLALLVTPTDSSKPTIELDLSPGTSPIRAPSYLIEDLSRTFLPPHSVSRDEIKKDHNHMISF